MLFHVEYWESILFDYISGFKIREIRAIFQLISEQMSIVGLFNLIVTAVKLVFRLINLIFKWLSIFELYIIEFLLKFCNGPQIVDIFYLLKNILAIGIYFLGFQQWINYSYYGDCFPHNTIEWMEKRKLHYLGRYKIIL